MGRRGRRAASALVGAALLVAGQAAPAVAAPLSTRPPYQFTVRAAPAEQYLQYFRELVQDVGFSRVQIAHRAGDATGHARALGAAYWLLTDDEPCLLGCEPPCPEATLINTTEARTANPRECTDRRAGLGALGLPSNADRSFPAAAHTEAHTPSDLHADALSRVAGVGAGQIGSGAAGSTSSAVFDPSTGRFLGSARSFVTDIALPNGQLAAVASALTVSGIPNTVPVVSYRLSLTVARDGTSSSGLDEQGFSIAGQQIPLTDLVGRVNSQLHSLGQQLSAFAELGIGVMSPVTDYAADSGRFRVAAPVVMIGVEPNLALPAPPSGTGVRLGTAVFEGAFSAPDPPLR
ncbi:MAG TPA: hypothetical protein VGL04_13730 [Sporichthyaceae bacterium]